MAASGTADKTMILLEQEKCALAAEYTAALNSNRDNPLDTTTVMRLESSLDNLYWRFVEQILISKAHDQAEALVFTDQERLLLDLGFLDESFVPDAAPGLRDRLLGELYQQGMVNHFYLSEWLADRYQRFRVNLSINQPEQQQHDDDSGSKFQLSRRKILEKLEHLLQNLQGITPEATSALLSGRLDMQLIGMGVNLLDNRLRRDLAIRHRLWDLRRQILTRARARTNDPRELKFFDVLDDLYQMEWRSIYNEIRSGKLMTDEERRAEKFRQRQDASVRMIRKRASKYLLGELHFARSLFPLGALAGGVLRSSAVMTSDTPRVTKADTARILQRAPLCDRNFIASPVVLIAPFRGRGIYEWDRDSLVISLKPVVSPADSAANAVANYTMLVDSLQKGGILKSAYKICFPDGNYQKDFQSDYRKWLADVAEGNHGSMDPIRLAFFREQVGLDLTSTPAAALAPVEIRYLTPQARHVFRTQLRRQVANAKDSAGARWRLGLLSWMDGDLDEAMREITHAAKIVPDDVKLLTGVGLLLSEAGRTEQAKQILQICQKRGGDNIWGVYAADALTRLSQ